MGLGPIAASTVGTKCKGGDCCEEFEHACVLLLCRKIFANVEGCFAYYGICMLLPAHIWLLPHSLFSL